MTDKLTQDVQSIVDDILQKKTDAEMIKETEEALNKSAEKINELAASLEAKDAELTESVDKIADLEITVTELSDKAKEFESTLEQVKNDFEAEKAEFVKKAEDAVAELSNLKKDMMAEARIEELRSEGVAASDEKAVAEQLAKIREMEDGEFAAYKTERVELRKAIVAELEASASSSEEETHSNEGVTEGVTEGIADGATAVLEDEEAAASSRSSIDPMKAIAAMLNMEIMPNTETTAKYRDLGKALADRVKSRVKAK